MAVQIPTPEQVKTAATEVGLSLTDADIQSYIALMTPNVHAYNLVDAMPDVLPVVRYPRTPGTFPSPEENTHNAWYVKTSITGAATGPLHGRRIRKTNGLLAPPPRQRPPPRPRRRPCLAHTFSHALSAERQPA